MDETEKNKFTNILKSDIMTVGWYSEETIPLERMNK